MRSVLAAVVLLAACSREPAPAAVEQPRHTAATVPISDLEFNDAHLQAIATHLRQQAQARGIDAVPGRNRVEALLALEVVIRGEGLAFQRVHRLVSEMTMTDVSQWGKLRQRAERDFAKRGDEAAMRVRDLLERWQKRKSEMMYRYLSSNYQTTRIPSLEWEKRFHDFVTERPMDAATWGWLLLSEHADDAQRQYGRADAESAYRFYLEFSGLGDGREARSIFSVPGIEIENRAAR